MNLFDLTGEVVLVTGSTKGIGRGIAGVLCAQGATVGISSRSPADCARVADELCSLHGSGRALAAPGDIGETKALETIVAGLSETAGRIDGIVCNAALMGRLAPPAETSYDEFMTQYDVNVAKTLQLVQLVAPAMVRRRHGNIVLIGSRTGIAVAPQQLAYSCAKAAMTHLARNLAAYYAPYGVRVNCIAPGLIRSDATQAVINHPDALSAFADDIPLKRMGEAEEIGGAAAFLLSAASGYVAGAVLPVDGGVVALPKPPGQGSSFFAYANKPPPGA